MECMLASMPESFLLGVAMIHATTTCTFIPDYRSFVSDVMFSQRRWWYIAGI